MAEPILELKDLKVYFYVNGGFLKKKDEVKAVDGISLKIYPGETFWISW